MILSYIVVFVQFPEMDESHINIINAIIANPEVIGGLYSNTYGLLMKQRCYTKVKL